MINESESKLGLTSSEALRRLNKFGLNTLKRKEKISPFKIFFGQFNDFITFVLIGATIISGLMGEKADAITILIIIIINAILGFIQEYKTEKSLEALKELAAPTAKVLRDGTVKVINAESLVVGDMIIIESGDRIPADCYIHSSVNLMMDESLLTGESVGVLKGRNNKMGNLYMGTIVVTGKGTAKVIATGMDTEMGKIAGMLSKIDKERSPLKERLAALGKVLVVLCIAICAIVTVLGIIRGEDKYQMFLLGVSLAVAAIPEGLPAIVTVALALGVSRMLKRNALIRKLPAVETLGCTSVICSDKTGTLTENSMTVTKLFVDDNIYQIGDKHGFNNEQLKKCFTYCNDCSFDFGEYDINKCLFGDPTEAALIRAFYVNSKELKDVLKKGNRIYEIPFDSNRKMMTVVIKESSKQLIFVKGATERLLDRCKYININGKVVELNSNHKEKIKDILKSLSMEALRCIGGAYKEFDSNIDINDSRIERDLVFIGIACMIDPPRKEVKSAVERCKRAGIRPVMITGDHKDTAFAIGKELNICKYENEIITGDEIENMSDNELQKSVEDISIFARVNPSHKLRIVKAFKNNKYIVAMTGDGVNDAPAVKEADIGISMGLSGTDVTKEASSMILLDDNFSTIVAAVEEGRVIYNNIRKFIRYLLSCNLGEVLTMFLSSLFYLETPLLPIQILFVNLATDGLPALALGVDPADMDVMMDKPRGKKESIFAGGLTEKILIRGSLIGVCTILSFLVGKYYGMSLKECRTLTLCTLILSQLMHVFECRSMNHSIFEIKIFTNMYLVGAVSISIIMLLCSLYIPFFSNLFHTSSLNFGQWLIVIFFSGIISLINSLYLYFNK